MRIFEINALTNVLQREAYAYNKNLTKNRHDFIPEASVKAAKLIRSKTFKEFKIAAEIVNSSAIHLVENIVVNSVFIPNSDSLTKNIADGLFKIYKVKNNAVTNWHQIKDAIVLANLCNDGNNVADVVRTKLGLNTDKN